MIRDMDKVFSKNEVNQIYSTGKNNDAQVKYDELIAAIAGK
jgi:hypothetical protein